MSKMKIFTNKKLIVIPLIFLLIYLSLFFIENSPPQKKFNTAYIFQTSDIHGYLKNRQIDKNGGWLRLGHVIEKELGKLGGKNNGLLIDCGDTFQGSVEAAVTKGNFAVDALNLLNYDIFVPGNHDFDYGINYLLCSISKLKADVLAANLNFDYNIQKIKPWKIYNVNNIEIAVIGMTSPYIKYWIGKECDEKYFISSITDELNRIIPSIVKVKPDVIVLALHHGFYNSKRFSEKDRLLRNIIKEFPEIDLVLGGHTHQPYSGDIIYANSIFVQPGAHGSYLAKIKIVVDKSSKGATPKIETELIPVTSKTPFNNNLLSAVNYYIKKAEIKTKEAITTIKDTIDGTGLPGNNCKIAELFAKAIFSSVKVDAVMCTVLAPNKTLNGSTTYKDIYEACPYEDSIMTLTLNCKELKKIFIEQNQFKSKYRKKLGLYIKNENRVIGIDSIDKLESLFKNNDKIKIAFSSYDIAGAGNRYPVLRKIAQGNKKNVYDTKILLREAVVNYLRDDNNSIK